MESNRRKVQADFKKTIALDDFVSADAETYIASRSKSLPAFTSCLATLEERVSLLEVCLSDQFFLLEKRIRELEVHFAEQCNQIRCSVTDVSAFYSTGTVKDGSRDLQVKGSLVLDVHSHATNGNNHVDEFGARYLEYLHQRDSNVEIATLRRLWEDEHSMVKGLSELTRSLDERLERLEDGEERLEQEEKRLEKEKNVKDEVDEAKVQLEAHETAYIRGSTLTKESNGKSAGLVHTASTLANEGYASSSYTIQESTYDACLLLGIRRYVVGFMAAVKIFIAILLGQSGIRWLVATQSIIELLLNAVALSFVFGFDELIFSAVAPNAIRSLMTSLRPLEIRRSSMWRSHFRGFVSPAQLAILLAILFVCVVLIPPEMKYRKDALDTLCGGFTDFVFEMDSVGLPYWAESVPISAIRASRTDLMLRVAQDPQSQTWNKLGSAKGSRYSLEMFAKETSADEAARWNAECFDVFSPFSNSSRFMEQETYEYSLQRIRELAQDDSFDDCSSLSTHVCNDKSGAGVRARQLCSKTCGCRSAVSVYPRARASEGCPSTCMYAPQFWHNPYISNCTQMSDTSLIALPQWVALMKNSVSSVSSWSGDSASEHLSGALDLFVSTIANLSTYGCQGITLFRQFVGEMIWHARFNLCSGEGVDNIFKGFAVWCPETCKCAEQWREGCPSNCNHANA